MTGVTDVSGANRLFKRDNRTKEITQAPIDWAEKERTKIKLNELVTLAATKDGLVNLRCEKNTETFTTFVNYCLIHLTSSITWRYQAYNTNISQLFTESDEALCILIIENNCEDLIRGFKQGTIVERKDAKPRYTKVDRLKDTKFKG